MFRQIPRRAMRLLLAITYLRVALVTALPIEGSGSDLSPGSLDSESRIEILDITVVYYNPHYKLDPKNTGKSRFLRLSDIKEIRLAEIKAMEKSEGRGKEEKVEDKENKRGIKRTKQIQRTNYAEVTPGLCLGFKTCYVYQKDSNGDPKIGLFLPYTRDGKGESSSPSNEKSSHRFNTAYHKSMLASLLLGSQSGISKEELFDTFSTIKNLQSALNKHNIHVTISDGKSLLFAMLQFMDRMKVLRGYYDKDQTLEQNMRFSGKPSWATLRFFPQPKSDILQTAPNSLCFDFWGMCLIRTVTGSTAQIRVEEYGMKTVRGKEVPEDNTYLILNLQLDDLYVEYRTDYLKDMSSMDTLRTELTSIKLLQESSELTIVNDDSLIRAILIHLQKNHWLSLTDEELKINLAKPLENLIYRGRDNSEASLGPSASSLTYKGPSSPVSSLDMTAPGQSGPSEPRPLPDTKKLKSNVGMVSMSSHQPDTELAASHESGSPQSSKRPSGHWFDTVLN
ncbi:hypothetical protein F5880DRAFT_1731507 [Lentinula raphanica]|nr:hypothetical protein F5880DRAFT_1731507 [Lentinula raphanica]